MSNDTYCFSQSRKPYLLLHQVPRGRGYLGFQVTGMIEGFFWVCNFDFEIFWGTKFCEAFVADQLTPRTPDLDVRGSSLACRVVSLDKEPHSTLPLFTLVYKWVLATYC